MGVIKNRGTKRGPGLAGALAVVVLATASGGRAGAGEGEGLAMRRAVPALRGASVGARLGTGALRWVSVRAGFGTATRAVGVHFPGPLVAKVLGGAGADSTPPPSSIKVLSRRGDAPTYPPTPDLRIQTPPAGARGGSGARVHTDLSVIRSATGDAVATLGRTVATTPWAVEAQPFWVDQKGSVHPLTDAQYEAALAEHNTLVVGDASTTLEAAVAAMRVPARGIPRELWASGCDRAEFSLPNGERRAVLTHAFPPELKPRKVTVGSVDDPMARVLLAPGTVLVRTRVVRPPEGADSPYDVTVSDAVAAVTLDPGVGGVRVVPLPSSAEGLIPGPKASPPKSATAGKNARFPRSRKSTAGPSSSDTARTGASASR